MGMGRIRQLLLQHYTGTQVTTLKKSAAKTGSIVSMGMSCAVQQAKLYSSWNQRQKRTNMGMQLGRQAGKQDTGENGRKGSEQKKGMGFRRATSNEQPWVTPILREYKRAEMHGLRLAQAQNG